MSDTASAGTAATPSTTATISMSPSPSSTSSSSLPPPSTSSASSAAAVSERSQMSAHCPSCKVYLNFFAGSAVRCPACSRVFTPQVSSSKPVPTHSAQPPLPPPSRTGGLTQSPALTQSPPPLQYAPHSPPSAMLNYPPPPSHYWPAGAPLASPALAPATTQTGMVCFNCQKALYFPSNVPLVQCPSCSTTMQTMQTPQMMTPAPLPLSSPLLEPCAASNANGQRVSPVPLALDASSSHSSGASSAAPSMTPPHAIPSVLSPPNLQAPVTPATAQRASTAVAAAKAAAAKESEEQKSSLSMQPITEQHVMPNGSPQRGKKRKERGAENVATTSTLAPLLPATDASSDMPAAAALAANAPKAVTNAYMIFCKLKRAELRTTNPSLAFGKIGIMLGEMWRELSAEERWPYEAMAQADRERYRQQMADFQARSLETMSEEFKKQKSTQKTDVSARDIADTAQSSSSPSLKEEETQCGEGEQVVSVSAEAVQKNEPKLPSLPLLPSGSGTSFAESSATATTTGSPAPAGKEPSAGGADESKDGGKDDLTDDENLGDAPVHTSKRVRRAAKK